jgi:hypothetical protein
MSSVLFVEAVEGVNEATSTEIPTKNVTKISAGGVFDAGVFSTQKLTGDGFLEFSGAPGTYRAIGLSVVPGAPNRDLIDFAIYLRGDAFGWTYFANGVNEAHSNIPYLVTDVFRIERIGTVVCAFRNGELVHTFAQPSTGDLVIDSGFYDNTAAILSIRLYDAEADEWLGPLTLTDNAGNSDVDTGTPYTERQIAIARPAELEAGDHLVALIAVDGTQHPIATSEEWTHTDILADTAVPSRGAIYVYRKIAGDNEPTEYVFSGAAMDDRAIGTILLYRGLPDGALVDSGAEDFIAAIPTGIPLTMSRPGDVLLAGVYLFNEAADVTTAAAPLVGATELVDAVFEAGSTDVRRLHVFEASPHAVGAVQLTSILGASVVGVSFAFVLAGFPELGAELAFTPIVPGAIGLPIKGI